MSRRPFAAVLADLDAGLLPERLAARLAEVVEAVMAYEGAGKLILELTVKPNGENSVETIPAIKTKLPEAVLSRSIMFVDDEHGLTRRDPRQGDLELRRVRPIMDHAETTTEEEPNGSNAAD